MSPDVDLVVDSDRIYRRADGRLAGTPSVEQVVRRLRDEATGS